jgi:hypothetical protein
MSCTKGKWLTPQLRESSRHPSKNVSHIPDQLLRTTSKRWRSISSFAIKFGRSDLMEPGSISPIPRAELLTAPIARICQGCFRVTEC